MKQRGRSSCLLYKGSTLRGGFGNSFKKIVCVQKERDCPSCILKGQCVYSYVFETPPKPDTKVMRKYESVPHPFIIEPPSENKRGYKPREGLTFGLTLVGKAIDFLPYFIYTFEELGKIGIVKGRGRFDLKAVHVRNEKTAPLSGCKNPQNLIYSSATKKLTPPLIQWLSIGIFQYMVAFQIKLFPLDFSPPRGSRIMDV
ncbi:MAG: hypothetical protein SWO11_17435 [Thermodesulfobacteriota bacterium]|nr:hypothetical protein [Thermodesulfobacteriota bacterium]